MIDLPISSWTSDANTGAMISTSTSPTLGVPEASSSSSSTSSGDLASTFGTILQEAITGLTKAAAQVASNRVAEFVEDRSRLRAIAEAAGWTPSGSSSSSSSSTSSSGSSSSGTSVNTNDPVYRLVTALGQTLLQALQDAQQDASSSSSGSTQTDGDPSSSVQGGTDQTGST